MGPKLAQTETARLERPNGLPDKHRCKLAAEANSPSSCVCEERVFQTRLAVAVASGDSRSP